MTTIPQEVVVMLVKLVSTTAITTVNFKVQLNYYLFFSIVVMFNKEVIYALSRDHPVALLLKVTKTKPPPPVSLTSLISQFAELISFHTAVQFSAV